ncbi:MAG TPA: cytochrome oxidase subunit III, partial [Gemmatimonadaceae bacterium]|nr:cytochrome oxidase subunit III [Gemmatimonadaceae bacterium]
MSASVTHTSAAAPHQYTTLGIDSRKIAIWAFIGSECMLFVSLISTYLIYKGRSVVGPFPHETWTDPATGHVFKPILNIPVTSASTFVLLMSSLFMVLALAAVQNKEKPKRTRGERVL